MTKDIAMTKNPIGQDEARAALDSIGQTRAQLAALANCPPWRHAAFGLIFAILVGSISISGTAQIVGTVVILVLVGLLVRSDLKRYGVFVNGYRRGATLPLTLGYVGFMIVLVAAAMYMRLHGFSLWSKLGLAALAFAMATALSVKWGRTYRREMGGDA
jgi:hypothetical protein